MSHQAPRLLAHSDGDHQDDHGVAKLRIGSDRPGNRRAVHPGHSVIEQNDVIWLACSAGVPQGREALFAGGGAAVPHTPTGDLLVQYAAARLVVVHDQDVKVAQLGTGRW
jgi:hypothetical protein